jgi:cobalt/nickel transport system permease protein
VAHIPDGFLSAPVLAGTAAASAAALAVAARRSRRTLREREAPVLGALTAFVFAGQMLNFPLGAGSSAHLLGATLVAALVGPWSGMLVLFAVLLVQALLFQDGGIAALGANTLNMAVLGVGVGYLGFRWGIGVLGAGRRRTLLAAGLAAFASTIVVGLAAALELVLSGTVPAGPAVLLVGGSHVLVGLGEAALTAAILGMVARSRPDLLLYSTTLPGSTRRWAFGATAVAGALAVVAAYVASARPDALEAAAERLGIAGDAVQRIAGPFAKYTAPIGGPWVAGVLGVVVAFALVWSVAALATARRRP